MEKLVEKKVATPLSKSLIQESVKKGVKLIPLIEPGERVTGELVPSKSAIKVSVPNL